AFFRDLPGLDAVDELITATSPGGGHGAANDVCIVKTDGTGGSGSRSVQLDTQGIPDIQKIYRAYHEGYSIVVNQVHRRSSAVALLCRGLEISLHHPVGCNLYLTPRGAQGFRPHVDTHDVFILQLHGEKIWRVGSPSKALPLVSEKGGPIDSRPDWKEFKLE